MGDVLAFLAFLAILGVFIGIPLFWHIYIPVNNYNYKKNKFRHGHSVSYCKEHNSICNSLENKYIQTHILSEYKENCWCCTNHECCLFDKYGSIENVKKYLKESGEKQQQVLKEYNEQIKQQHNDYIKKLKKDREEYKIKCDKEYRHGNTLDYCEKHKYDCECLRYKKGLITSYCKSDRCIIKELESSKNT